MSEYRPTKGAQVARWTLRGVMILAIVWLAIQQGFDERQMIGVAVTIIWALLLPVALTWTWRSTNGRPNAFRFAVTLLAALVMLAAFFFGARPLLS